MGELRFFAFLDAGDVTLDQRSIGEGPQMLGGLQFWGVAWKEAQAHMVGRAQPQTRAPARLSSASGSRFLLPHFHHVSAQA